MAMITTQPIEGANVYGVPQVSYSISGRPGEADYGTVLAMATLTQSAAIEKQSAALSDMVHVRMEKLKELGEALSIIARALASMQTSSSPRPTDLSSSDYNLLRADAILRKYGIDAMMIDGAWRITRETAMKRKNDTQYAMDSEDNALQQDMLALQSLVAKRDNSFSTASKLMQKFNNTSNTLIGNIGG